MKSLLIITRMDYRGEPHQRFHQQVKYWGPRVERLTVLYRRWNTGRSCSDLIRALLSFRCHIAHDEAVQLVEVDPFWNLPVGFFIKYLSFLQDFSDILCMFAAFLLRV